MTTAAPGRSQAQRLDTVARLAPGFRERSRRFDEQAAFPRENCAELREAGLLSLTVAEDRGGHGLWWDGRFSDYYEFLEALARADTSTAQLLQVHSHALGVVSRHATPAQADEVVAPIVARGELLASVGSETNPRTARPGDYRAELEETSTGWRLTCHKFFASLAPAADHLLLWVAVPGQASYPERTVTVLVPRDAPGVELIDEWDVLGMRPTVSWSVKVTDYDVPDRHIFGEPGFWVTRDPRTFTLGFAANHAGSAQAALDFTCDWVRERPYLAQSELVQLAIGEMTAELAGASAAVRAAAAVWDTGDPDVAELESLKALHLAKRAVLDTTQRAFDVCGARTAFRMYPLEMMYRDARTFTLHFRDELTMRELGESVLAGRFSAKRALDSSVLATQQHHA